MSGRHPHLYCEMGSHGHESQTHSSNQHEKYMDPSNEEPRGGATPGPGRSYALPLKNWDLALGPACDKA